MEDAAKTNAQRLPDRRPRARSGVALALRGERRGRGVLRASTSGNRLWPAVADPDDLGPVARLGPHLRLDRRLQPADPLAGDANAAARWLAAAAAERRKDAVGARAPDLRRRSVGPLAGRTEAPPAAALVRARHTERQRRRLLRHADDHAWADRERLSGAGARPRARAPEQLRRAFDCRASSPEHTTALATALPAAHARLPRQRRTRRLADAPSLGDLLARARVRGRLLRREARPGGRAEALPPAARA